MAGNNPTGINQYSGGGKGGKIIKVKSARTGGFMSGTRDAAAQTVKSLRTMKSLVRNKTELTAIKAQLGNYSRAARLQAKKK